MSTKATQRYYNKWVRAIAKNTTGSELHAHIIHHAKDLNDSTRNNPDSWIASMYNLLSIYEAKHKVKVTIAEKLYKLAKKYFRFPGYTAPPGGKIPDNADLKYLEAGRKRRPGEIMVSSKDIRSIGRGGKTLWQK